MPALLPDREYIKTGLSISYRGSPEPQLVQVRFKLSQAAPNGLTPHRVSMFVAHVKLGAYGGAEFAPESGDASLVEGSFDVVGPGSRGPDFAWTLRLAGVSPHAWRVFVDLPSKLFEQCEIVGDLAPSDPATSVVTSQLVAWIQDPKHYPGRWGSLRIPSKRKRRPTAIGLP